MLERELASIASGPMMCTRLPTGFAWQGWAINLAETVETWVPANERLDSLVAAATVDEQGGGGGTGVTGCGPLCWTTVGQGGLQLLDQPAAKLDDVPGSVSPGDVPQPWSIVTGLV